MKKEVIKLTKTGLANLKEELRQLTHEETAKIDIQLAEARAQGDYSENSDLDAARKRKEEIHNRIKQIEEILANAEVLDDTTTGAPKKIALGTTAVLKNLTTNKVSEYTIVSSIEADPFKNWISDKCLVGSVIIGKSVGDIIEIKSAKPYKVEVLEIKVLEK